MRRYALVLLIALASLAAVPPWLQAQQDTDQAADSREEALKRIEMLRLFRLTEVLELNEDDAARVFPIIQRYDREYRDLLEKRESLMHELQLQLNNASPDRATLSRLVDEILALEREAMRIRNEQFKELKKILTAEQYAKYLVFDAKFREDLNRMLDDIRRQRPPRR